ncbi:MAG: hypothetical protein GKR89_13585 [Candidatus Latescibacteria bacterium]|nr:hypothetical protein [Candidatus Latescibacterota bacterium]
MDTTIWLFLVVEVLLGIGVVRLIWRAERDNPTENIVPATEAEVELVE